MTTLLAKANSFLGHAYSILLRYVPKAQSEPVVLFLCFSGLDFTQKPNFCNHLKSQKDELGLSSFFKTIDMGFMLCRSNCTDRSESVLEALTIVCAGYIVGVLRLKSDEG